MKNSSNTAASPARLILQNGGSSGGDAVINLDASSSGARWSMGVDRSASKWVLASGDKNEFDGSDEKLTIESTGAATFAASVVTKTVSSSHAAGNITLDFTANQNFILTLTGNIGAVFADGTERVGASGIIVVIQDGTGSRTLGLSSDFSTVGGAGITLSTAANSVDIIPYFVQATDEILLGAPQKAFS